MFDIEKGKELQLETKINENEDRKTKKTKQKLIE